MTCTSLHYSLTYHQFPCIMPGTLQAERILLTGKSSFGSLSLLRKA